MRPKASGGVKGGRCGALHVAALPVVLALRCRSHNTESPQPAAGLPWESVYLQVRRVRERDRLQLCDTVHLPACQGHQCRQPCRRRKRNAG